MWVYVSAPSVMAPLAREAMIAVRTAGHKITRDWVVDVERNARAKRKFSEDEFAAAGRADIVAIRNSEVLICLVSSPRGPSVGVAVEMGAAYALGRPVILVESCRIDGGLWKDHPFRLMAWKRVQRVSDALWALEEL
jgi:nucleoside 2-deoxyribosyltransferase